jgi:hypothetical protein
MGGFGGITRFGLAAVVIGGVGASVTAVTTGANDRYLTELDRDNAGKAWAKRRALGDDLPATIDGKTRLAMSAGALGSVGAAIGMAGIALIDARLHRGSDLGAFARSSSPVFLGAAAGLTGAALLGGTGSVTKSLGSLGNELSSEVHASMLPTRRSVRDRVPGDAAQAKAAAEPRSSERQLLDAPLTLKPGTADMAAAKKYAAEAIKAINWSKPDIALWVPGTGMTGMDPVWTYDAHQQFTDASVSAINYPATVDFASSVSTGMETVRLVLAEIAKRGGDQRVMIGGHSQGAWVIGDAMRDPAIHGAIDRAVLYGNPGLAAAHYDDRRDGKVVELNDRHDPVHNSDRDRRRFMRGLHGIEAGITPQNGVDLVLGAVANSELASYWESMTNDGNRWSHADPHVYTAQFRAGLEWLDTGAVAPGEQTTAYPLPVAPAKPHHDADSTSSAG